MIQIHKFSFWYASAEYPALDRIKLDVAEGEFLGVVGANGAGKTTLCYALSGFIPHFYRGEQEGEVHFAGKPISQTSLGELAGQVGLVFQNPFNQISGARFTVREEIAFGLENLGLAKQEMERRIEETLDLVGIRELADRSPFSVSGGQQQRIAIASILAMQPRLLVLDEPTSQLDPQTTHDVFATLRSLVQKRKITVVLAEHKLEWLAAFCDRVVALSEGRIRAEGTPEEVLASPQMLRLDIGRTQYSEVAARLSRKKKLPVTLEQARQALK
jgi:energy-coupling factor transporter ATP-binding protein EcfA2